VAHLPWFFFGMIQRIFSCCEIYGKEQRKTRRKLRTVPVKVSFMLIVLKFAGKREKEQNMCLRWVSNWAASATFISDILFPSAFVENFNRGNQWFWEAVKHKTINELWAILDPSLAIGVCKAWVSCG